MSTKRTASTAFAGTRMPTWPCNWRNETVGACWSKSWNSAYAVTRPRRLYLPSHWRSFRSTTRHFRLLSKVRRTYSKWVAVRVLGSSKKHIPHRVGFLIRLYLSWINPSILSSAQPPIYTPIHPSTHPTWQPGIHSTWHPSIHSLLVASLCFHCIKCASKAKPALD